MFCMGRAASAACVGVCLSLVLGAPAFAAGPKPDPPPIKHAPPPPPPAAEPAPPAPQPPPQPPAPQPPPVAAAPAAPVRSVTHPTAAERRAKAANARAKAAALHARAARQAARRKAAQAKHRAAATTEQIRAQPPPLAAGASGSSSVALPILLLACLSAVVMLGLALTPTRAVPWSRASHALEDHRDELGVIGFFALVATMVFFVLVQVTK